MPALPEILAKLLEACEDEQRPLKEISEIISKDPILSFKVLQLVNSSYYSLSRKFTSVEQAVIYLGSKSIKNIAVATAVHQVFEQKRFRKFNFFNIKEFWWHSLLTATYAKRIARKVNYSNCDEAYLSGLLHDIGQVVLVSAFPEEHVEILGETDGLETRLQAEKRLLGVTHCDVGAWLVRRWNLNSLMADAIKYHHGSLEQMIESFTLIRIVYLANVLCHDKRDDIGILEEEGERLLDLEASQMQSIITGATDEMYEIAQRLDIRVEEPDPEKKAKPQAPDTSPSAEGNNGTGQARPLPAWEAEEEGRENLAQVALQGKVKNIALLTGILENLTKAETEDEILGVFEEAVNVLFGFERVLFLLPDVKEILLRGKTSSKNPYRRMSQDITMPINGGTSQIIKVYRSSAMTYMTKADRNLNPADRQTISALKSIKVFLVPLSADKSPVGIILIGIPACAPPLREGDYKLLQALARQIGSFLHIERLKSRKAAEIQEERMAAVSMTARKFAHEVNNPLGIITNYLTALKLKLAKETNIQSDIDIIHEEIERISSMVNQLDLFSQPATDDITFIDLNEVIDDIVQLVKSSLLADNAVTVSFDPGGDLPHVKTSRNGVKQILINLLKNGAEAMQDGGEIAIATRLREKEGEAGVYDGVQITIRDDGPGLPEQVKENLFRPFVTTKKGNHSGLGLSIVYRTVQVLGGEVTCASERRRGTEFTIVLPLQKGESISGRET